ncbi:MAG: tetratricopeptide repeat protein [Veillonellales bacterium]
MNRKDALRLFGKSGGTMEQMTAAKYIGAGVALAEKGELREAALSFCQAVKVEPDLPEAYQRLGEALISLEYWDNAQKCFCRVIELDPSYAAAYNYLGVVLKQKNRLDEAEECYRQAIRQKPDYAEAFHNLGNCLKAEDRFAEAETAYRRALELKPDLFDSRFSLGTLYLLLGQYEKGWKLYDSRMVWQDKFRLDIPIWQGETLTGRKILLFYEQGFGDMIQFVRYAYPVAALAETTVWIQRPLERLLSGTQNVFAVCQSRGEIKPEQFDFACSLMSLPAKLNSAAATVPNHVPYLRGANDIAAKWRERIGREAGNCRKVGVVWAGNPGHSDDKNRSIPFELFRRLFTVDGVFWVSLQVGKKQAALTGSAGNLFDCSAELVDFAETAGVIANLDLVIAVDTAVAHLAGAMGKETWVLLPFRPDWRWGLGREDSTWYPTMRLFRQYAPGDWQTVLERVKAALRKIV